MICGRDEHGVVHDFSERRGSDDDIVLACAPNASFFEHNRPRLLGVQDEDGVFLMYVLLLDGVEPITCLGCIAVEVS